MCVKTEKINLNSQGLIKKWPGFQFAQDSTYRKYNPRTEGTLHSVMSEQCLAVLSALSEW